MPNSTFRPGDLVLSKSITSGKKLLGIILEEKRSVAGVLPGDPVKRRYIVYFNANASRIEMIPENLEKYHDSDGDHILW